MTKNSVLSTNIACQVELQVCELNFVVIFLEELYYGLHVYPLFIWQRQCCVW